MEPGQRPYPINEPKAEGSDATRKMAGVVLVGIGAVIALMVVERVFRVLSEAAEFPLIERLMRERGTIVTPGGDVVLPEGFFVLASYGIVIVLLGIVAGLARAFLASGTQLLHLDVRTVLRAIREQRPEAGTPPPDGPARS